MRSEAHTVSDQWLGRRMTNKDHDRIKGVQKDVARVVLRHAARSRSENPLRFSAKPNGSSSISSKSAIDAIRAKAGPSSELVTMSDNEVIEDIYSHLPSSSGNPLVARIGSYTLLGGAKRKHLAIVLGNDQMHEEYTTGRNRLHELAAYPSATGTIGAHYSLGHFTGEGEIPGVVYDTLEASIKRLGMTAIHFQPVTAVVVPSLVTPNYDVRQVQFSTQE